MPVPVHPYRVTIARFQRRLNEFAHPYILRVLPLAREDCKCPREDIVVYESGVHGKSSHQQYDVPPIKSHGRQLVQFDFCQFLLSDAHEGSSERHQKPVTRVAKHDSKEKRKSDDCIQPRVDLRVLANAIGIDNSLKCLRELIRPIVRWRRLVGTDLIDDRRHGQTSAVIHVLQG